LPPAEVEAMLLGQHWTPAAAAHYAATVPVDVVPGLRGVAGEYQPAGSFGPARVRVFMPAPYAVAHEMHHAWDDDHGLLDPVALEADLRALAAEDCAAGAVARRIVERSLSDYGHYNHGIIDSLGGDVSRVPGWYAARYFGFLAAPVRYRLVLPVVR
jgi:hypothetical protein